MFVFPTVDYGQSWLRYQYDPSDSQSAKFTIREGPQRKSITTSQES